MSTVAQVVERTYREWLHAPEDQPVIVTLAGGITDSDTTVTYDDSALAPEEEDLLGPGTIIEFAPDGEQCRITAADEDTNSLTVVRAVNGTNAAAHTAGAEITAAPTFSRHAVIEAVKDNVVTLYPSLWQVATYELTTASSYVEVPASVVNVRKFLWLNGTRYQAGTADLLTDFSPSSTGNAVQFYGIPTGRTGYLTYEGKFGRPDTTDNELADLGVETVWERIVAVGAAAQVVGGRPVDELTAEFITEQLQREALPAGASTDIRNGLLTLRNVYLDEAHRALRAERSTAVVYNVTSVTR